MVTDWTFAGTWPFEPHRFDTLDGRMHYVDEGPRNGRPVVLLHGNPTWGYLYRNFIGPLTAGGHRAIVPTTSASGARTSPTDPSTTRFAATPGGWRHCSSRSTYAGPWSCRRTGAARSASTGRDAT